MKLYNSFLLRCWVIRETAEPAKMVFDIEHIQKGEHCRAATPDEAIAWITAAAQQLAETAGRDAEAEGEATQ